MPFDSPDLNLGNELLKDVGAGKIRLPDFQRDWKWDVDRISGLLASVSLGYPVGVVMLLETGGADVQFATRLVSGVEPVLSDKAAERLILDGQQRLTALYQALACSRPVQTQDTRKKRLERWFYMDMEIALDPEGDREAAIVAVPADRLERDNFGRNVVLDVSTTELECQRGLFPLAKVFDVPATNEWMMTFVGSAPERIARWNAFYQQVLSNFIASTVPVIVLRKDTPREAVCTVFEKVNTGGVVLDVFELLTATFVASEFDLRQDWEGRRRRLEDHKVLRGMQSTDFLQALALLVTRERRLAWSAGDSDKPPAVSCKRRDILRLTRAEYQRWAPQVERGFLWAAQAIGKVEKIRRWYWCGVLGELYGGAIETRFANDLQQVTEWCSGGDAEPITVYDSSFDPGRLLTLRTRNSAAYKGIYALLMRGGSKDWLYEQDITMASHHSLAVNIHHIFPKKWCADNKIDDLRQESIVNKTAISAATNRKIGGRAPSKYIPLLQTEAATTGEGLRRRIEQHYIDFEALAVDGFDVFFDARRQALLELIAHAIGKSLLESAVPSLPEDFDIDEEELSDDELVEAVA